jgi:hypothetical protein
MLGAAAGVSRLLQSSGLVDSEQRWSKSLTTTRLGRGSARGFRHGNAAIGAVVRRAVRGGALFTFAIAAAGCGAGAPSPQAGAPAELAVAAPPGSGQARLATGTDGLVVLSWLEPSGAGTALRFSVLEGAAWGEPRTVTTGEDFFVNWADLPAVVPITADNWVAHWLRMPQGSFAAYDIAFATSRDGGASFAGGDLLNEDGVLTEHGFVSWFPWGSGIGAVWLDGRLIGEQFESGEFDPEGPPVGMSLRYARLAYDGTVEARGELDELVCDCCPTSAAAAAQGPVVVYRDRTADELRDISLRRHAAGAWSDPITLGPDGWRIEGCPVNGPAVAAAGDDVAAAWFTAADGRPRVRFARSVDGGESFGAPVEIDGDGAFGQVGVVLLEDRAAVVSWWRRAAEGGIELTVRRVTPDGQLGEPLAVAANAAAQPLDVPQLAAAGKRLVLAWTDAAESRVRTVEVPLP